MQFDYSKLLGRIRERRMTQSSLADDISISRATLSLKLNNRSAFAQDEIKKICGILNIPNDEIGAYFFDARV